MHRRFLAIVATLACVRSHGRALATVPAAWIDADSTELVWPGGESEGSCDTWDLPDAPARAWRTADGTVHLVSSWATLYTASGPNLTHVSKDRAPSGACRVAFNSTMSGQNSLYSDHEWLVAPWLLEDGTTVVGYMHQEYHGWEHGNCTVKPNRTVRLPQHCWMVALTSTVSTDGGYTFRHGRPPPDHIAAVAPYQYVPNLSGFGYGDPTGLVRHQSDGYYYMLANSRQQHGLLKPGACVMRTADPADITAWRAWDGAGFTVTLRDDPYNMTFDPTTAGAHVCEPLPPLGFYPLCLKWSTYYRRYMAVGEGMFQPSNGSAPFFAYMFALSDNLTGWSTPPGLIRPALHGQGSSSENYASVLDADSTDANFNDVGREAYFFYTHQHRCSNTTGSPQCRDLMRQRIVFSGAATDPGAAVGEPDVASLVA